MHSIDTDNDQVDATEESAQLASEFSVTGMTCSNCAMHVMEAIRDVPGVSSATVNLEQERASVRWADATPHSSVAVIQAVEQAGYTAKEIDAGEPCHTEKS